MSARTPTGILALVGTSTQPSRTASNVHQPTLTLLPTPTSDAKTSGRRTSGACDPREAISNDVTNIESPTVVAPFVDEESSADAVLAVEDVAKLMRVGRNTIYALVGRNQIPHRRLGKQIRFSRASVMSWLSTSWQVAKEGK